MNYASSDPNDYQASEVGSRHELRLSRRACDAVRARAAELDRTPSKFLEQVITAGLAALAHLQPPQVPAYHRPEDER